MSSNGSGNNDFLPVPDLPDGSDCDFLAVPELPDSEPKSEVNRMPESSNFMSKIRNNTRNSVLAVMLVTLAGTSYLSLRQDENPVNKTDSPLRHKDLSPEKGSGRRSIDLMTAQNDANGRRIIDQTISKTASDAVLKYSKIAQLSEQKIFDAYTHFSTALSEIRSDKALASKLLKSGIKLREPEFYLAIAIKESALNPEAGKGSYVGYLQLRKRSENPAVRDRSPLKDLEDRFGLESTNDDLFNPKNNAKLGILYFHLCRDEYLRDVVPEPDKDLATYFAYNVGQGDFKYLWEFFKSDSFDDFEKKVSTLIARQFPKTFAYSPRFFLDKSYGISYYTHLELIDPKANMDKKIKINGRVFNAGKLFRAFRYVRTIESINNLDSDSDLANK